MIKVFVTSCHACVLKDAVSRKTDRSEHPQAELIRWEAHNDVAQPTGTQKTGI
jgi:hypothetical protein